MRYPSFLGENLGAFLLSLKLNSDSFYLEFLNKYGDKFYSTFFITDERYLNKKGLYLFTFENIVYYIGRCRETFGKRINQGYGKIAPKNCYRDGQATNCHINSLITENPDKVRFYVHIMENNHDIIEAEKYLIAIYKPIWNDRK